MAAARHSSHLGQHQFAGGQVDPRLPAGGFEKFFEEMGKQMADVHDAAATEKTMREVMAKHGMELLGPPLFKPSRVALAVRVPPRRGLDHCNAFIRLGRRRKLGAPSPGLPNPSTSGRI